MKNTKYLTSYNGNYYFRIRVPKRLQSYFKSKFIKKAIGTKDIKTAKIICSVGGAKAVKLFALSNIMDKEEINKAFTDFMKNDFGYFEKGNGDSIPQAEITEDIDNNRIKEIARDFFNGYLKHNDDKPTKIDNPKVTLPLQLEIRDLRIDILKRDISSNELKLAEGYTFNFLERRNINLDKNSEAYKKLIREMGKALIEAFKIEKERVSGNFNNPHDNILQNLLDNPIEQEQRVITTPSKLKKPEKHLTDVIAEFFKEKVAQVAWSEKNEYELKIFYKDLPEIIGNKPILDYTKTDFTDYIELLKKMHGYSGKPIGEIVELVRNGTLKSNKTLSETTIRKYLVQVNMVFEYARQNAYITTNYCVKIKKKDKRKDNEERDVYDATDLKALFNSPIYTDKKNALLYPERWWIPIIALYSGMRLNEIAQLYKEDIIQIGGIWCFDINDEKDKNTKTKSSNLIVPISPVIIGLGFLDFINSFEHERVFKNLFKKRDGYAHYFTRWYNKYNRKYVTKNEKRVFHSFRHTFIDNLKQQGLDKGVRSELVGHSTGSITDGRYGKIIM
ncbi:MAG: site-specific integrase [Nitrospirae bacterium]|nr:site-specific integrase [Nitrospirota bacterium]MBF0536092.1 site-specific integrase [Nitrospirota bacterium]MBF0617947.1 site-specific integrase [Nitrospirota bacterium]